MAPFIENIGHDFGIVPAWIAMFLVIFLRYTLLASAVYGLFYIALRKRLFVKKIQQKYPKSGEIAREINQSVMTAAIFASMAFGVYFLRKMGFGHLYFDIADFGWPYFIASLVGTVILHDTYFYWTHRLMHHPKLFARFHRVHHLSHNPTPFTALSFHPLESVVEFGIIPILALFVPLHVGALIFFTIWSTLFNVLGHSGFEFMPSGSTRHPFLKWLGTATHHNLHHQRATHNFGLYFNFWDRVMGTNHPQYEAIFEEIKNRPGASSGKLTEQVDAQLSH